MITTLFCTALLFTGFGIAIGLMAAFWKPRKSSNYEAPYHRFNGDPQPGTWYPGRAQAESPRHRIDVWARETGAI